jgi:hypothetical protein
VSLWLSEGVEGDNGGDGAARDQQQSLAKSSARHGISLACREPMSQILAAALLALASQSFIESSQSQQATQASALSAPVDGPSHASQDTQDQDKEKQDKAKQDKAKQDKAKQDKGRHDGEGNHVLGLLPNYSTVRQSDDVPPIATPDMFKIATFESFDPQAFAFVGMLATLAQIDNQDPSFGPGAGAFGKRYAIAFADNSVGNFMTSGVMPFVLKQDPRYFAMRSGGWLHRAGYAASRSVITRSRAGRTQFNFSEIGGNTIAAGMGNAYHPAADRTWSDTLSRAAAQVIWDTVSNEMKEFWPDIRRRFHHTEKP